MVSTLDFESSDPSSNLGGTCMSQKTIDLLTVILSNSETEETFAAFIAKDHQPSGL